MPAYEVTELYRRRWDIEVFFKFIKQNLGYKHFLSHAMNGIKVYIYMIIITALLFLVYKIRNNLRGFKIALLQFTLDLNDSFYTLNYPNIRRMPSITLYNAIFGTFNTYAFSPRLQNLTITHKSKNGEKAAILLIQLFTINRSMV
ncbi:transposase [Wolbachia endosymbiont (group A) of Barypeithes pellucidus]|uniref:transposase n=1 Tax=Wolbachia endosymbiont (group A) of Barypeithes pellucidus TaxID=3139322 RepID=UPI003CCB1338